MISVPLDIYDYLVETRHTVRILDAITKLEYIPEEVVRTILGETIKRDPDADPYCGLPFDNKCIKCIAGDDEPYCDECGVMEE